METLSYCKFCIYTNPVNLKFTIWQRQGCRWRAAMYVTGERLQRCRWRAATLPAKCCNVAGEVLQRCRWRAAMLPVKGRNVAGKGLQRCRWRAAMLPLVGAEGLCAGMIFILCCTCCDTGPSFCVLIQRTVKPHLSPFIYKKLRLLRTYSTLLSCPHGAS